MKNQSLRSRAWLWKGIGRGYIIGYLELKKGRLSFSDNAGQPLFDAAHTEISALKFPWYLFGGGMTFQTGNGGYRVSFVQPDDETIIEEAGDFGTGRETCKQWKAALAG